MRTLFLSAPAVSVVLLDSMTRISGDRILEDETTGLPSNLRLTETGRLVTAPSETYAITATCSDFPRITTEDQFELWESGRRGPKTKLPFYARLGKKSQTLIPEDAEIERVGPWNEGSHKIYAEAMRLVGARHGKGSLVALVHWLLTRIATAEEQTRTLSDGAAQEITRLRDLAIRLTQERDELLLLCGAESSVEGAKIWTKAETEVQEMALQRQRDIFDWIERRKVQVWYDELKKEWVIFPRQEGQALRKQPSAPTLRAAMEQAMQDDNLAK